MRMAKHTSGPWVAEPVELKTLDFAISKNGVLTDYDIYTMDGEFITVVQHPFNGKETKANALLIAAAPTMLEALRDCREALRRAGATGELEVVNAAIAKAGSLA